MRVEYADITSRLGAPLWHDSEGVPRYEPFTPYMATVYGDYVALLEVECQSCGARMVVAEVWSQMEALMRVRRNPEETPTPVLPTLVPCDPWASIGDFHYGDPPHHDIKGLCLSGPTMNSIPVRVIEFWGRRHENGTGGWVREPRCEIEMPPLPNEGLSDDALGPERAP